MLIDLELFLLVVCLSLSIICYMLLKIFNFNFLSKRSTIYAWFFVLIQITQLLLFKYEILQEEIYLLFPFEVFYVLFIFQILLLKSKISLTKDVFSFVVITFLCICFFMMLFIEPNTYDMYKFYYHFTYHVFIVLFLIRCLLKYIQLSMKTEDEMNSLNWIFFLILFLCFIEVTLLTFSVFSDFNIDLSVISSIFFLSSIVLIQTVFIYKGFSTLKASNKFSDYHYKQVLISDIVENEEVKYRKSKLSNEELEIIHKKLKKIEKDELFLDADLDLDFLSNSFNIPKQKISQAFGIIYQTNFKDYINLLRCNHSLKYIIDKNYNENVVEIAYISGFNSRGSFYRCFKKYYGCSPLEYRLKNLN